MALGMTVVTVRREDAANLEKAADLLDSYMGSEVHKTAEAVEFIDSLRSLSERINTALGT